MENAVEKVEQSNTGVKNKKIIIGVFGVIVLILAIFGIRWFIDSRNYISTEDAKISADNISVTSKLPGRIAKILIKEGDVVKKDQVLAQLDSSELSLTLQQAQANYDMAVLKEKQADEALNLQMKSVSAQTKQAYEGLSIAKSKLEQAENGSRPEELSIAEAKMDQAKTALDKATAYRDKQKDNYTKMTQLYNEGTISQDQFKQAELAYNQSEQDTGIAQSSYNQAVDAYNLTKQGARQEDIDALKSQVEQAQAVFEQASSGDAQTKIRAYDLDAAQIALKQAQYALDLANINYNNSFIKAPCDGTIVLKSANEGDVISPGQSLFSLIDFQNIWVSANIKETDINKFKIGSQVKITVDVEGGKEYNGQVYEIGDATNSTFSLIPSMNTSGNFTKVTQLIPIKIKITDKANDLKVGSSVEVKVKI